MISKSEQLSKNSVKAEKPKRLKKCHYCEERSVPYGDMRTFCFKNECIEAHNNRTRKAEKRKGLVEFNQKDKSYLMKIAKTHCHAYILKRDLGQPCISCGQYANRYEAGHYMSAGGNGHIRFDENNIHAQCHRCNCHMSANLTPYRVNLIKKIGLDEVNRLETRVVKVWTVEELREVIEYYKQKGKEIA